MIAAFIAVLFGAVMLTYVVDFSLAVAGELLIAVGMGVANAIVFKMAPKYVPEAVGGAAGIVGWLGALGGFIYSAISRRCGRCAWQRGLCRRLRCLRRTGRDRHRCRRGVLASGSRCKSRNAVQAAAVATR